MERSARWAVVGATGTVGLEVLAALLEQDVPSEQITLLGSERSVGEEVEYGEDTLEVEKVLPESFRGMSAVVLAVPKEVARPLATAGQAAGAWVVDVSPAHRLSLQVPLVLPTVNLAALERPFGGRIVATPGAVTAALLTVLEPLRTFGVRRVFVTALLGASSAGKQGIAALERQTSGLLSGREEQMEVFPHRLAFNLVPQVGAFEGGRSEEERSWAAEAARIWEGQGELPAISGTAVQVPTFFGHALSLTVELGKGVEPEQLREALRQAPGVKVLDAPAERIYPMPMLITADPTVHVGRIRAAAGSPGFFELFAVVDNAGRGAGWNAVEVAKALVDRA